MFKFLKDKISGALSKFKKDIENEVVETVEEKKLEEVIPKEEQVEEKKLEIKEETAPEKEEKVVEEKKEEIIEEPSLVEEKEKIIEEPAQKEEVRELSVEEVKEQSTEEKESIKEGIPAEEKIKEDVSLEVEEEKKESAEEKEPIKEEVPEIPSKEEIEDTVSTITAEPGKASEDFDITKETGSLKDVVDRHEELEKVAKDEEVEKVILEEEKIAEDIGEVPKEKGLKKIFGIFKKKKETVEEKEKSVEEEVKEEIEERAEEKLVPEEEIKEEIPKKIEEEKPIEKVKETPAEKKEGEETSKKKSFAEKIKEAVVRKTLSDEKFEELFWDLELAMLENNVAVSVIEKIKEDLKNDLQSEKLSRFGVEKVIKDGLRNSINSLFDVDKIDLLERIENKKPYIICFVGINGVGKTTALAKLAYYLKSQGLDVIMAAADTFRVAAIEQLQHHADSVGVKMIKHEYGSDSAAVAFDAIAHAKAKGKDVVLIDTAGRSHANANLMDELRKVIKVNKPDLTIFVGDSLTGNDAVEQAQEFDAAVGVDGIILTKVDADEKGGAAISISHVTQKPILFIGTGQTYDDLKPFDKNVIIEGMGLD